MKYLIALTLLALAVCASCGGAKAVGRGSAEVVEAPLSYGAGYVCFLIRDENGKAAGGNCLPR